MRAILLSLCMIFFLNVFATASTVPTKNDAEAFVKQAVAYVKTNGRVKFLREVQIRNGVFHFKPGSNKDLYIFAYDEKGVVLAHGARIELVGKNRWNDREADGRHWVREWTDLVRRHGRGWIAYKEFNPSDKNKVMDKLSFVELVDGMVVGCGIYGRHPE
jgi:cytochrome c